MVVTLVLSEVTTVFEGDVEMDDLEGELFTVRLGESAAADAAVCGFFGALLSGGAAAVILAGDTSSFPALFSPLPLAGRASSAPL